MGLTAPSIKLAVNKIKSERALSLSSAMAASLTVIVGQSYWLQLVANNAQKLFLCDSVLNYDKSRVQIDTSDGQPIWESGEFFPDPEIDVNFGSEGLGTLAISISPADGADPGVDGSGELIRIKFTPLLSGLTSLTWSADSGAYTPDPNPAVILRRVDANFSPLDLQASGVNNLVFVLNVLPA